MTPHQALDRLEITDLVMRYCRGIDRRDFTMVRSLYWDDGYDDHGAHFQGTPDDYVAWLPAAMDALDCTIHAIHNSLIVVDGDRAEGEHQVTAFHRSKPPDRQEIIIYGRYLDRYEKRDDIWKFSHRRIVFDHGYTRPVDEAGLAAANPDPVWGTADREDPSWQLELLDGLHK